MKPFAFSAACLVALLFSGCNTINHRIEEKSAAFSAADAATQEKIRQGVVAVGYTPDLVYIALGNPDRKRHHTSKDGEEETWIYNTYYQEYAGTANTEYRRYIVVDPRTGQAFVYIEPVYTDLYRQRREEDIRVIFQNGKVAVIEQTKDI